MENNKTETKILKIISEEIADLIRDKCGEEINWEGSLKYIDIDGTTINSVVCKIRTQQGYLYDITTPDLYKFRIKKLQAKLSGEMTKDFELQDEIQRLTMIINGVKPTTGDDKIECEGCGS